MTPPKKFSVTDMGDAPDPLRPQRLADGEGPPDDSPAPASPPPNPLGTEDHGKYKIERFYCHASANGKKEGPIQVWVPPSLYAQMASAREAVTAYKSWQDLIRDALTHRMHWVSENYDTSMDPHSLYNQTNAWADTEIAHAQERLQTEEKCREALELIHQTGDVDWYREAIKEWETRGMTMSKRVKAGVDRVLDEARRRAREMK